MAGVRGCRHPHTREIRPSEVCIWAVGGWYAYMVLPDTLILATLMLINLISLGGFALWLRIYIEQALMDIDEKLALAIQALVDKLMSGGLAEFEPPNPIQGAIAQLIQGMAQQKMNTFDANITQRGPDGQFTSATDLE